MYLGLKFVCFCLLLFFLFLFTKLGIDGGKSFCKGRGVVMILGLVIFYGGVVLGHC